MKFPRAFYIPSGAVKVTHKTLEAVVYLSTTLTGRPAAVGFQGKADKPSLNYSFSSEQHRARTIANWFKSYASAYRMKPVAVVAGKKMYEASHWTAYH
jgi:hypothetical protein